MASLLTGTVLMLAGTVFAAPKKEQAAKTAATGAAENVFYIYTERGSRLNHYVPSGWMGDYGDIKMNQGWIKNQSAKKEAKTEKAMEPKPGEDTCIQVRYTAERKQGAGWAGIYWQHPANNWGDKRGGFDLSSYAKLTFMARGEQGGEVVDKFFIGGITGQTEEGDSDEASISPVTLTKEWKKYEVSLKGLDMSHIIGGFGFAANADANPDGFIMYLDDIRLEK
ncbi:MAG: hypothetical protein KCHDKBKB_02947 [Elusimicrobia bacterium]|nr:hypothetical protein [Elusimicrobiota bacterium]